MCVGMVMWVYMCAHHDVVAAPAGNETETSGPQIRHPGDVSVHLLGLIHIIVHK
jgi:hypothetical protein